MLELSIQEIDKMPSSKEKLNSWIQYAKKNNCFHLMPEIQELYLVLKEKALVNKDDWNAMLDS